VSSLPPPQLSVVVPVHNEQDNIRPLVAEIRAALDGRIEYEVIYVDDGSSDASPNILNELHREFPRLRILRHPRSHGQSAAILSGVRAAGAPWIATLDGDGQNDPADIPALLAVRDETLDTGAALMVCGHRRRRRDTWLRRLSSRIANGVRSRLLRDDTPDTGCGLKLFPRDAFLAFPFFDHLHRFLPALMQRSGGCVVSVEVNHRPRERGTSHYGVRNRLWVGIIDMLGVMWLQRRAGPAEVVEEARDESP